MSNVKLEKDDKRKPAPQPGKKAPPLTVPMVGGGTFDLHKRYGTNSALIVFYRGRHCPKCEAHLQALDRQIADFNNRGISLIAISMGSEKKAESARDDWRITHGIHFGYGLTEKQALDWGLSISRAEFDNEPERFNEPGMFLVDADDELYAGWLQSTPFARPATSDVLTAIDFVRDRKYPPRGKAA